MKPATPTVEVVRSDRDTLVLRADCLAAEPDEIGAAVAAWAGPDARVQLVLTDPPYGISHDSADSATAGDWDTREHAKDWALALARLRPLCASNATAFVFGPVGAFLDARTALPDSSGWHPLQDLVWTKENADASGRADPDAARAFFPVSERVLFAEAVHVRGSGEATPERDAERAWRLREEKEHDAKMAPLVEYFDRALRVSGLRLRDVAARWPEFFPGQTGAVVRHYFGGHQWQLPTPPAYAALQAIINPAVDRRNPSRPDGTAGREGLRAQWEGLRAQWEELRAQWEELRRPFFAADGVTPTDLLRFPVVPVPSRVHPCQKPLVLLSHLVRTATRPGDIVLDPFAGSGSTGVAALACSRRVLLVEREPSAIAIAERRLRDELRAPRLF